MLQSIMNRRSIRKYKDIPVSGEIIREILTAGNLAPSSKNRQPWRFVVVSGKGKEEMLAVMEKGLLREEEHPMLPDSRQHLSGARHTLAIMKEAPVTIFVVNSLGADLSGTLASEERIYEICNAQSIGAAMENMSLMATELGVGSLWICDTFFAHRELREWLGIKGEPFGAMALGYADEQPGPRPRHPLSDIVEWRSESGLI